MADLLELLGRSWFCFPWQKQTVYWSTGRIRHSGENNSLTARVLPVPWKSSSSCTGATVLSQQWNWASLVARTGYVMASGPITSWEIDGETVSDFILGGSKITADGDCSHEIKRCLLLGRKVMTSVDMRPHGLYPAQAPLSVGFSRQEYWSGLPFPSPGDLPDPGIEPRSPALQADSLPTEL